MMDGANLRNIDQHECLRLLASVSVGRIAITDQAMPVILPVTFIIHGGWIVIRTTKGSKLSAAADHAVVAMEVDCIDESNHEGWSVLVVGRSRLVGHGAEEFDLLESLDLPAWAARERDHFVLIDLDQVSGRRLAHNSAA
ncbi:MAG TPA: pyridoxamine 5'-phosphate oxidase family protein [Stackebrandtia sp.]|jgi:nitroimidazol reductase NimA-like FMN-containing flavoprotein (pyridoxamine 5'-phosphate oxidase superfamily)|uniref:pyridoxamine 5'-phosphate oxidase family protein n=1 Tax=Stackebrandtia sp. TaxID=2023065 RepID=UPI002D6B0E01|nr:pyridoxamine 5'-phosphate oxidase family protein [Stackebrandtia sp.]HZE41285.1 pyridoxamine 5'-phosphate oxidase family protein [Stackebrandtia sp.]